MATTKRKKTEKSYTYHEYVQKFRPKSLPKEEDHPTKHPFTCLSKSILDDVAKEDTQTPPNSNDDR